MTRLGKWGFCLNRFQTKYVLPGNSEAPSETCQG
jgi:hypothetical protein